MKRRLGSGRILHSQPRDPKSGVLTARPRRCFASEKKIFEYFFKKFSISVAMATNQNQIFGQNSYGW